MYDLLRRKMIIEGVIIYQLINLKLSGDSWVLDGFRLGFLPITFAWPAYLSFYRPQFLLCFSFREKHL